jgi:MarR family 2-MHQ and catechol resistance regulon transcriptional repressor
MNQFVVAEDGRVYETSVRETVTRLKELFPEIDPTSLEANILLERSHRLLQGQRESYWAKFGLTGQRFVLLRLLYTSDQRRLSMSEIAAEMNQGMNNVTQLVGGLVRDALVERVTAEDDKRVVYAVLTAKGEEMFAAVFPPNAQRIEAAWSALSESEQKLLIHLLSRLRLHLLAGEAIYE